MTLPRTIVPVQAMLLKKKPLDPLHYEGFDGQPKLDGFRALLHVDSTGRRKESWFVSKTGRTLTRFPYLRREIAAQLPLREVIMDGEVIAPDPSGKPIFTRLLSGDPQLQYVAFDLLYIDGEDLRALPFTKRLSRLYRQIPQTTLVAHCITVSDPTALFERVRAMDLEGVVVKKRDAPYDAKKAQWYKVLNPDYSGNHDRQTEMWRRRRKT